MRLAAKVDGNHKAIVATLRNAGAAVLSLAAVGHGVPDLLVYFRRTLYLLEVKDGSRPPSARRLRPAQEAFRLRWPVSVVTSEVEALKAVGAL